MYFIFCIHCRSLDDSRFAENQSCVYWFNEWENWIKENCEQLKAKEKEKMFISQKLIFDLRSMVMGFQKYCETLFGLFPGCQIRSDRSNQDNLEQFFGRQRAQNGQNNNPTELQYGM
jgi:hypothetical protein